MNPKPISPVFNGCYTITNRTTGEHRTFRIRTQGKDSAFASCKRILSLLMGSNNEHDYRGFAFVGRDGSIRLWRKMDLPHYRAYARLIRWTLVEPRAEALAKYEIQAEGRCIVCNRKLTHPDSIKTGIGPICAQRE